MKEKPDILQGTLALMVLKTLDVLGPQHGYRIARRIEQISGDVLAVNQGTLYPLLLKLEERPEHRNSLVELVLPHACKPVFKYGPRISQGHFRLSEPSKECPHSL